MQVYMCVCVCEYTYFYGIHHSHNGFAAGSQEMQRQSRMKNQQLPMTPDTYIAKCPWCNCYRRKK